MTVRMRIPQFIQQPMVPIDNNNMPVSRRYHPSFNRCIGRYRVRPWITFVSIIEGHRDLRLTAGDDAKWDAVRNTVPRGSKVRMQPTAGIHVRDQAVRTGIDRKQIHALVPDIISRKYATSRQPRPIPHRRSQRKPQQPNQREAQATHKISNMHHQHHLIFNPHTRWSAVVCFHS